MFLAYSFDLYQDWYIFVEANPPYISVEHLFHGPLARCVKLRFARESFPATAGYRFRHVSRHVRDARAEKHAGVANVPDIPNACAIRNFTYLVRGPWRNAGVSELCTGCLAAVYMPARKWGEQFLLLKKTPNRTLMTNNQIHLPKAIVLV